MARRDHSAMSCLNKRSPLGMPFSPGFPIVLKTLAASLASTGINRYVQNVVRI
jgi:hypothetical protein